MKFFLDTEFYEDGSTIDLISIGVVTEDGREFYAVSQEAQLEKKPVPVLVTHTSDCRGCGGTYICPRCGHVFGYCVGAWDDTPALCDDCANVVQFDGDP